jgi:hypothetical protein
MLEGFVGPLGAQPILPIPNLASVHHDTWLSLLELRVWSCRIPVHVFLDKNIYSVMILFHPKLMETFASGVQLCLNTCTVHIIVKAFPLHKISRQFFCACQTFFKIRKHKI